MKGDPRPLLSAQDPRAARALPSSQIVLAILVGGGQAARQEL